MIVDIEKFFSFLVPTLCVGMYCVEALPPVQDSGRWLCLKLPWIMAVDAGASRWPFPRRAWEREKRSNRFVLQHNFAGSSL